jgi:predicted MFS family arabinose efflux permease
MEPFMLARILWLALGSFAVGTETFVVSALLPSMADDLGVTVAAAGVIVTVFALAYAIGSPVLSVLSANVERKRLLLASLVIFTLGNLLAAGAHTLAQLVLARVVLALAAGTYIPAANAVAAAVAGPQRQGRGIAIVVGGMTVAVALGVPLGAWLSAHTTWRAAFLLVAVAGAIAAIGLLVGLPRDLPRGASTLRQRLEVARRPDVLRGLAVTMAFSAGVFELFTFLAPLLTGPARLDAQGVSAVLFLFGIGAAAGNLIGGQAADRFGALRTVRVGLVGMTVLFLATAVSAGSTSTAAPTAIIALVGLWGVLGWKTYSAQMTHLVRLAPQLGSVTLSLNSSAFYIGVAGGSALGAVVLSAGDIANLAWIAAAAQIVALAIAGWPRRVPAQAVAVQDAD